MNSFKALILAAMTAFAVSCSQKSENVKFVTIDGENLRTPKGEILYIQGTNLGNWLNPEGYMFSFRKTNSATMINDMFSQMVGPDRTAEFWEAFKENYITEADIEFIASTGANTIRLPFNYKLFTDEDYMGRASGHEPFKIMDKLVGWCRTYNLFLILDMHDCPAGQTGDNIDDSYGYPWLFESETAQKQFCEIWKTIADHYKNEPVILGYELMNEPIATYFDAEYFNPMLEPLYKKAVAAIREVDTNHIILLGGAQWNGTFTCFEDWKFDDKIMYTCHRYGGGTDANAIRGFIDFKEKTGLPMYMGEIGHNTDEWQAEFVRTMKANNIGYTFWPYKKINDSCWVGFDAPENWDIVVNFSESERGNYFSIRENRPDQEVAFKAMMELVEKVKFENCHIECSYIASLQIGE